MSVEVEGGAGGRSHRPPSDPSPGGGSRKQPGAEGQGMRFPPLFVMGEQMSRGDRSRDDPEQVRMERDLAADWCRAVWSALDEETRTRLEEAGIGEPPLPWSKSPTGEEEE